MSNGNDSPRDRATAAEYGGGACAAPLPPAFPRGQDGTPPLPLAGAGIALAVPCPHPHTYTIVPHVFEIIIIMFYVDLRRLLGPLRLLRIYFYEQRVFL